MKAARKGMFGRLFTEEGYDMRRAHPPVRRSAVITRADGTEKYREDNIEAPEFWSDMAIAIASQKYFYGHAGSPQRETSIYDMIDRVVRTNGAWMGFQTNDEEWEQVRYKDQDIAAFNGGWDVDAEDNEETYYVSARPEDSYMQKHEVYFNSYKQWRVYMDELKEILITQRAFFNSPVWFNVGVKGPKASGQQCSACFINRVEDDMSGEQGILDLYRTEGRLFKNGSGSGTDVSRLRSKYEVVEGGGYASGPLSFMKGWDHSAGGIKSGGKTRRAAIMRTMYCDHPEIQDFIECKTREEEKAKALGAAGFGTGIDSDSYATVAYQNANLSVRLTDNFMNAVERGTEWHLLGRGPVKSGSPYVNVYGDQAELIKTIPNAKTLFRQIAQHCWESGDPGVQFDDTINSWHTCRATDRINSSNPCSEFLFLDDTACNLASLNLLKLLDMDEIVQATKIIFTAMEGWVSNASYPTRRIAEMSHMYRPLGLGYGNLGALLMSKGIPYDSDDGRLLAASLASLISATAYYQSTVLADEMGAFIGFAKNEKIMRAVMQKHSEEAKGIEVQAEGEDPRSEVYLIAQLASMTWNAVTSSDRKYRNSQATVIAPTGTIGLVMDYDTTGIEPYLAIVQHKKLVGGGELKIVCSQAESALCALGYRGETLKKILVEMVRGTPLEDIKELDSEHWNVFKTSLGSATGASRVLSWQAHMDMLSAVQPFISGSISKTVNMPNSVTVEDIEKAIKYAWDTNLKCVAIYRDGCKMFQPTSTTSGESNEEQVALVQTTHDSGVEILNSAPTRKGLAARRTGDTLKFKVGGHKGYLTSNIYPDDKELAEIFTKIGDQGAAIDGWAACFSIVFSVARQYGIPLEVLVSSIKDMAFEPQGFTADPEIRNAPSIPSYIVRRLALDHLDDEALDRLRLRRPTPEGDLPELYNEGQETVGLPETSSQASGETIVPKDPAAQVSPSGRVCPECYGFEVYLVGAANCIQCQSCGWEEGGCTG